MLRILFEKHGLDLNPLLIRDSTPYAQVVNVVRTSIDGSGEAQVHQLLSEIVRTQGDLRTNVSPRYLYDERWRDLRLCLALDGYLVDGESIVTIEPAIEGAEPLEDDLTQELQRSGLKDAEEVLRVLGESADSFRRIPPDYNGCLSNARVALQTLVTNIAKARQPMYPGTFDETKWGQVLAYLRTSGFIDQKEEDGISGVYSFVSPGAHHPIGLSEEEMARLGRSLVSSMCYFLIKEHNGTRSSVIV